MALSPNQEFLSLWPNSNLLVIKKKGGGGVTGVCTLYIGVIFTVVHMRILEDSSYKTN